MNTILYLWLSISIAGHASGGGAQWQQAGEYYNASACRKAVATLGVPPEKARCVSKYSGEPT